MGSEAGASMYGDESPFQHLPPDAWTGAIGVTVGALLVFALLRSPAWARALQRSPLQPRGPRIDGWTREEHRILARRDRRLAWIPVSLVLMLGGPVVAIIGDLGRPPGWERWLQIGAFMSVAGAWILILAGDAIARLPRIKP